MEEYVNLNTVTLYNTPQFNKVDTLMFETLEDRDQYFNSITDKLELTDYTDLYEGREINLPRNYLDLKKYNTMKLHFDDGLNHITDYYCNVDNYQYVSTDCCTPIYRIDYFLTYGHLLYDKDIEMITDRRTVKESNVTKYMKPDEMSVPKLSYYQQHISRYPTNHCYIIFLNKTKDGVGKKGITTKMMYQIGIDSENNPVEIQIDTHTIGCYILVCNDSNFANRLTYENPEYIEKVIESDFDPRQFMMTTDYTSYQTNGYVYITSDVTKYMDGGFSHNNSENLIKNIIFRLPYYGTVIQGNEYDPNDFDENDKPTVEDLPFYNDYIQLITFNNFGYSFIYPIGYKGEPVSYDYMYTWQSGRNFSYTSDYTNTLAYKELLESNSQAINYTERNASLNTYYNNALNTNSNKQLDITKKMNTLSYESQINSLNTQATNTSIESQGGLIGSLLQAASLAATGDLLGAIGALFGQGMKQAQNMNNISLLNSQANSLNQQKLLANTNVELQQQANNINTNFQCDTIALARDNSIANISISNKYNNAKPNAYNPTDYTKYTSYIYLIHIDDRKGTDKTQYNSIVNHYNVEGINIGYLETWKPSVYEGNYFDYIKGSVIDNSNELSDSIDYDVFIQLITRIESGIRIWHDLSKFGNMTLDNTAVLEV